MTSGLTSALQVCYALHKSTYILYFTLQDKIKIKRQSPLPKDYNKLTAKHLTHATSPEAQSIRLDEVPRNVLLLRQ